MFRSLALSLAVVSFGSSAAFSAPPTPAQTLEESLVVLDDLAAIPMKSVPPSLLAEAHGVAIIPRVIKAGFIVGGRGGHGIVLVRGADGTWGNPTFVDIGGASVGFQAGVQSTDLVLVFRTRKSLDRILEGKGKVTLGADASVAAGPIGRQAEAGTDARLQAEIVSYSRSRGLFAGVALDGAVLANDYTANTSYLRDNRPEVQKVTEALRKRLTEMSGTTQIVLPTKPDPMPTPLPQSVPALPPPVIPNR
jgi:lipid-binding SYLF domain-containing protein